MLEAKPTLRGERGDKARTKFMTLSFTDINVQRGITFQPNDITQGTKAVCYTSLVPLLRFPVLGSH